MTYQSGVDVRLQELEELVGLGEKISQKIEEIRETLAKQKDKALFAIAVFYVMLASLAFGFIQSMTADLSGYRIYVQTAMVIILLFSSGFFVRSITSLVRQRKKLLRELDVERDILARITRMIYDQLKLVQSNNGLTAIGSALFQMRIQRLQGG